MSATRRRTWDRIAVAATILGFGTLMAIVAYAWLWGAR